MLPSASCRRRRTREEKSVVAVGDEQGKRKVLLPSATNKGRGKWCCRLRRTRGEESVVAIGDRVKVSPFGGKLFEATLSRTIVVSGFCFNA